MEKRIVVVAAEKTPSLFKPLACYVVGVVTTAVAVSAGHGRSGLICFGLGILSTLAFAAWALKSQKRAAWVVKQLSRIAQVQEPKPTRRVRAITENEKPSVVPEVVQGLKGLGCEKTKAAWAAKRAASEVPSGNLDEVLRLAIGYARN